MKLTEIPPEAAANHDNAFGFPQWPHHLGRARVLLDGVEQKKPTAYSIPAGWVETVRTDACGNLILENDSPTFLKACGVVEVEVRAE